MQAAAAFSSSSSSPSHKSDVTRDVNAKEERGRGRTTTTTTTTRKRKESLEGGYQGGVVDGVDVKDFAAMKLGVEGVMVGDGERGEGEDDGEGDGEDDGEGETCGGEGKVTDYSGEVGGTQRS